MRPEAAATKAWRAPVSVEQIEVRVRSSSEELQRTASRYSPLLYRAALRQLGDREDAENTVQDALVSALLPPLAIPGVL